MSAAASSTMSGASSRSPEFPRWYRELSPLRRRWYQQPGHHGSLAFRRWWELGTGRRRHPQQRNAHDLALSGTRQRGNRLLRWGIINNGTSYDINRSTLSGNSSPSAGGYGGANSDQPGGHYTITDSKVTGNSATALGGGIQNQTGGTIYLNRSSLTANSASFGGGIFEGGGTLKISASKVIENSAGNGGGAYKTGAGTMTVDPLCVFEGNSANNSGGTSTKPVAAEPSPSLTRWCIRTQPSWALACSTASAMSCSRTLG